MMSGDKIYPDTGGNFLKYPAIKFKEKR